uniref:Copia protein n=1 Tax=Tanacetum cinerariifolium TaxID=118510 RepID=A0A6L2LVR6_TANCI|nr:copia protein [Tanacetum cinerariifolium]
MESLSPQVVSAAKLPILNPNEFDLWKIRIEQNFLMTDYSLWEVILNGDSPAPTRVIEGVLQPVSPTTAEKRLARKNELKARGTLLMALPDKHQLKFNTHKDSKTLMEAIEKGLERNKTDLEEQSLDDLFNSLKIYEAKVKSSSFATTSTQNIAFVSSSNTDSTNEPVSAAASAFAVSAKIHVSALPDVDSLSNVVIYSFFSSQSNSLQLDNDDLKQIDANDLKEMDLKWEMAIYDWSFQAEEEPTNYALMAFSSSSSSSDNELRDNALVSLRQNLEKAEQEKDDLKLKLEKFQTSSKNLSELLASQTNAKTCLGYNSQVFTRAMFDCDDYLSSESDESLPSSPIYDRPSVQHVETSIPTATSKTAIPKPTSNGKRRDRKACFVCKILDHLIKDYDYHEKKMAQTTLRNNAQRGTYKQYAQMTLLNPHRHVVPVSVLTQFKLLPINAVRPVSTVVLKISVTRPRQAKTIVTKTNSPPRRHIDRSPSPKASTFPPKVNAIKAPMGNPQHALKDKGVIDSGCSRHMTWNMSYLFDFEELNGGYVSFVGNPKGGSGPTWLFDIDTLTKTMNYQSVTAENQSNPSAGVQEQFDAEKAGEKIVQQYVLFPVWSSGFTNPQNTDGDAGFDEKELEFEGRKPDFEVNVSPSSSAQSKKHDEKTKREAIGKSPVESLIGYRNLSAKFEDFSDNSINEDNAAGTLVLAVRKLSPNSTNTFSVAGPSNAAASPTQGKSLCIDTFQLPDDPNMPELEGITYSGDEDDVGAEAEFNNLETSITEEGIDYEEVFAPVARIEAIRLFLAYASFMGFMVYQMDVKSAFLYRTIEEEVYDCQPLGFKDPDYPDKVYKVVKALYGLHQAPRAWYETMANYLLENGFQRGKIDQKLFIKRQKDDILLVQIYVKDITFSSTNKDLCKAFEKLMKDKFQMSLMGELIFFLGFQVKQKKDGIFISQDKYIAKILRKFGLTDGKSAITLIYTEKPLLKDPDGVNTPRCDDDRLELMELKIFLLPSDEKVKYALTVNPNIYVLCIKQFWTSVAVKKVNDIMRLQALVDKKKVIITESTIRDALHLDDAEGIECLPNEEIFTELSRMGYEKPSAKLTFYKAFFSSYWKFLIHTILQCMSAKRTSWNEFSSSMASVVICLSTGRKFNFSMYIFDSLVRNVDSSTKFFMYPCFLQLMIRKQVGDLSTHTTKYTSPALTQKVFANMRRVGKGFSGVETPLFEGMIVQQVDKGDAEINVDDVPAVGVAAKGDVSAADDVVPTAVTEPSIPSPTPPTLPPQPSQD